MAQSARTGDLIERARHLKMTPAQRRAQRVSLVVGLSKLKSGVSRDKVETIVAEFEGVTA